MGKRLAEIKRFFFSPIRGPKGYFQGPNRKTTPFWFFSRLGKGKKLYKNHFFTRGANNFLPFFFQFQSPPRGIKGASPGQRKVKRICCFFSGWKKKKTKKKTFFLKTPSGAFIAQYRSQAKKTKFLFFRQFWGGGGQYSNI